MDQSLSLLVIGSIPGIGGFYLTKYSYKVDSDWGYRGKILGPGSLLFSLILLYRVLEAFLDGN